MLQGPVFDADVDAEEAAAEAKEILEEMTTAAVVEELDQRKEELLQAGVTIVPVPGARPIDVELLKSSASGHLATLTDLLSSGEAAVEAADVFGRTVSEVRVMPFASG